jgi:acyl-CoA reductase-like NAD-dependent aldehyde dehydrogenase
VGRAVPLAGADHRSQPPVKHKRHWLVYRPLGVVGAIAPWNYPMSIPLGEVGQALAAGNGVLLKRRR